MQVVVVVVLTINTFRGAILTVASISCTEQRVSWTNCREQREGERGKCEETKKSDFSMD